jgi:hypothetical protein
MSYSRWSNGYWYCFYSPSSGDTKDTQLFEICDIGHPMIFSYKELTEDIDGCLEKVKEEHNTAKTITFGDGTLDIEPIKIEQTYLDELKIYMKRFIQDVENDMELDVSMR